MLVELQAACQGAVTSCRPAKGSAAIRAPTSRIPSHDTTSSMNLLDHNQGRKVTQGTAWLNALIQRALLDACSGWSSQTGALVI
jgi:hypothetical protein